MTTTEQTMTQPPDLHAGAHRGKMVRWAVVVAGCLLVAAAFYTASANRADATCSADPPGVAMPEHNGRSLELRLGGWDCVLVGADADLTTVQMGWWPGDPAAVWTHATTNGLDGTGAETTWSADPFPVSGWLVELIGTGTCSTSAAGVDCETTDERLASPPCVKRFEYDYPDWTTEGCGFEASFVDGVSRFVDRGAPGQDVHEEDHGDGILNPNPWFAPVFDEWQGRTIPAGTLTLYPRELVYGGADVIGLDDEGVPVLYVQRNQSSLEEVWAFVRSSDQSVSFPTEAEVAAALDVAGLPDAELAEALVSHSRREAATRQFTEQ